MQMKNLFPKSNILILTPLILVMVFDFVFTSIGQPTEYWQDSGFVNEGNFIARYLLVKSYLYFTLTSFVYGFLVILLIIKTKRPINIIIAVSFFLIHSSASSSWPPTIFEKITGTYPADIYLYLKFGYLAIVGIISGFCIDKWLKIKNDYGDSRRF